MLGPIFRSNPPVTRSCPPSGSGAKRFTPPSSRKRSLSRATRTPPARKSCAGEVSWKVTVLGDFNQRKWEFNGIQTLFWTKMGLSIDFLTSSTEVASCNRQAANDVHNVHMGSSLGGCPSCPQNQTCLNHLPGLQVGSQTWLATSKQKNLDSQQSQ